jgi:predicted unusual protein kinase regulating ubiquinone biosynthesis (AarF/ABC1/UbiB family)
MCRQQGGIYIKAAQGIASMPFAFPQDVIAEFEALQDSADPQAWSEVQPRVEKHTPGGVNFIYESFNETAINAASIAQVHAAHRKAGSEKVAVKVLRRNIQKTFDQDITNYLAMLGMYEAATGIAIKWMQEWVMEELKKEIDFRYEADLHENAHDFIVQNQRELKGVTVPILHSELCTSRLLVMEFVDGVKITKVHEHFPDWDKERDLPQLFDRLENWLVAQLFVAGKFHGDPHPGNVLIRKKKGRVPSGETPFEIVVIDHGGYCEPPKDQLRLLAELWGMMDKPRDEAHRLRRKARVTEILNSWGVGHHCRFIQEQLLAGHMGTADPTSDLKENGAARMHRFNKMANNGKESGPDVFADTTKMPPEIMKFSGAVNFLMGSWGKLAGRMRGWNAPERHKGIMMYWAKKCSGARVPP